VTRFGYCLTPDTSQQRFVVAVGEGQNGKSVALDVLTALLGPENVSHVRAELFAQRFQLTMTLGKLANVTLRSV
jgi:putative DNA primase/helicase